MKITVFDAILLAAIIGSVAVSGGLLYVGWHFVSKLW